MTDRQAMFAFFGALVFFTLIGWLHWVENDAAVQKAKACPCAVSK